MDEKVVMSDEGETLHEDQDCVMEEKTKGPITIHELYEQGCAHPFPNSYTMADVEAQPVYASYEARDHCFGRLKVKRKRCIAQYSDASMFKRVKESYHRQPTMQRQQYHTYFSKPWF